MKAEQRKELETNVLANQMGKLVQKVRSPQSSSGFVWGILVLLAVLGGIYVYQRWTAVGPGDWIHLNNSIASTDLTKVGEIAAENPGTVLSRSARFQIARTYLEGNLNQLYVPGDRDRALQMVCQARASYERLATECSDNPLLYQEAVMGAARAEEALIGVPPDDMPHMQRLKGQEPARYEPGKLSRAIELYRVVAGLETKYPDSYLVQQAKKQLERLKNGEEVVAFYEAMNKDFAKKKKAE